MLTYFLIEIFDRMNKNNKSSMRKKELIPDKKKQKPSMQCKICDVFISLQNAAWTWPQDVCFQILAEG